MGGSSFLRQCDQKSDSKVYEKGVDMSILELSKRAIRPGPPQVGGLNGLTHLFRKKLFFSILNKIKFLL